MFNGYRDADRFIEIITAERQVEDSYQEPSSGGVYTHVEFSYPNEERRRAYLELKRLYDAPNSCLANDKKIKEVLENCDVRNLSLIQKVILFSILTGATVTGSFLFINSPRGQHIIDYIKKLF